MQVQFNTDNHIKGSAELSRRVDDLVKSGLERFRERLTRVEVHVSDESRNARYSPNDKRCVVEARLAGRQPVIASHDATTVDDAVAGAVEKMAKLLGRTLDRLSDPRAVAPKPEVAD